MSEPSLLAVTLVCLPRRDDVVDTVLTAHGSVSFVGSPVACTTDEARVALALLHGMVTRAERDYARLQGVTFHARGSYAPCWTVTFDMSDYLDALARL